MILRRYDAERDKKATRRIWREVGWYMARKPKIFEQFLADSDTFVAEIDGAAETLVTTMPGTMRHLETDLPWCAVTGVTTSRVARKQGLAARLTALALAEAVAGGAAAAGLGMFEQGYYNQLGFGTGGYEVIIGFDPSQIDVAGDYRQPRRIRRRDWKAVHASMLARKRGHGAVTLASPTITRLEMSEPDHGFGLGYFDGPEGALSHHTWFSADDIEHGPYHVWWMSFQSGAQLRELLLMIKSLGDQVRLINMKEPAGIMLQDVVRQPFKQRQVSRRGKFEARSRAVAYWQMRICDLAACLAHTHLPGEPLSFNLRLSDPISDYLEPGAPWEGVAGDYRVTLGPESTAVADHDDDLPTLTASVGAFTRMWLGVRPASGLAVTDDIDGPPALLAALDRTLRLPAPHIDWDI